MKTLVCKILSDKLGRDVKAGEFIEVEPDIVLANDITAPLAIKEFKETKRELLFPDKVVLVEDHFVPAKDIASANQARLLRDFANEYNIKHYYSIDNGGIEHILLPDEGIVLPGDVVIGADSHTCTYGALGAFSTGVGSTDIAYFFATGKAWFKVPESISIIFKGSLKPYVSGKDLILYTIGKIKEDGANYKSIEFSGDALSSLTMADRFTMCNMVVEAGAKAGIIAPDEITIDYIKDRAKRPYKLYKQDPDCEYEERWVFDCNDIELQVAFPPLPSNTKPVSEARDIKIDQAFIGSCTNGSLEDLRNAALILKGRKINSRTRCIIIPATKRIYEGALKEGLIEIFLKAGAIVSWPTCGPCLGGHMGILADNERCISTTNRNFTGRMGSLKAEIYLASPVVVASSAIMGRIAHPEEIL